MSTNQLVLVPQETRTVLTASFLKTPELKKWSMDQGNLISESARMHRLGLEEQRQTIIAEYCEKIGVMECHEKMSRFVMECHDEVMTLQVDTTCDCRCV